MNSFQPQEGSVDLNLEHNYISNLPTDVKEELLMKLPIKEVVKTSLLSTQWKYIYMGINSKFGVYRKLYTDIGKAS